MNTRQRILEILRITEGYVSGEKLSEELGISRNAVFKAVDALRKQGCSIEGINRKGYRLLSDMDTLDADAIASFMERKPDIRVFETIDSTNDEARRLYHQGVREPVLLVADQQTKGRGRRGRDFYSPPHTGIYMTLLLFPDMAMEESLKITTRTAVVIAETIEGYVEGNVMIKWVNDLYYRNRKFCGILTEAITDFETRHVDAVILGIGINVTTEVFPGSFEATSLGITDVSRNELAGRIADGLLAMMEEPSDSSYMDRYRKRSILTGRMIGFEEKGVMREGLVKGISDEGHLIVEMNGEEICLSSGEISIRKDFLK